MTTEERLAACEAALAALQARVDALARQIERIGDYAGENRYELDSTEIQNLRILIDMTQTASSNFKQTVRR